MWAQEAVSSAGPPIKCCASLDSGDCERLRGETIYTWNRERQRQVAGGREIPQGEHRAIFQVGKSSLSHCRRAMRNSRCIRDGGDDWAVNFVVEIIHDCEFNLSSALRNFWNDVHIEMAWTCDA